MQSFLSEVFSGKTVLVTGNTGFKGSWLSLWLARLGANVIGYSWEPPTNPSNFVQSRIADVVQNQVTADVRDTDRLFEVVRDCRPDLIIHMAAQTVVRTGYSEPFETFSNNVMGTAGVLEAIRKWEQPCSALLITSDKCYENREQIWGYRENDAMGERDPYGGSKGAAELVIRSYRHSFFSPDQVSKHGVKIASARGGNVIGGGDWTPDALIVDIVKALLEKRTIAIRNPNAFRPWQHVLQALSGYLLLSARLMTSDDPIYCSGWNIGPLPGSEIPVHQVVDRFIKVWGSGLWTHTSDPAAQKEAGILRVSIDKAIWNLGWNPAWDVNESISQTALWYRKWMENPNASMRPFCASQIEEYEKAWNTITNTSGELKSTTVDQPSPIS